MIPFGAGAIFKKQVSELLLGYVADWNADYASRHGLVSTFGDCAVSIDGLTFDGSDYASFPDSADTSFGTADFDIEFYVKFNSVAGVQLLLEDHSGDSNNRWFVALIASKVSAVGTVGGSNVHNQITCTTVLTTGVWYKINYFRVGTTFSITVDDANPATATGAGSMGNYTSGLVLGRQFNAAAYFNGVMKDLKIRTGAAVTYNAAFTADKADRAIPSNSASVPAVLDSASALKHASQALAANQGTYNTSGPNGHASIAMDAANDVYTTELSITQGFTIHAVAKVTSSAAIKKLISDASYWLGINASNFVAMNLGSDIPANSDISGEWHVITYIANGASSSIRVDGSEVASGNVGESGLTNIKLGELLNGEFSRIIVYDAVINPSNNESFLKAWAGI